MQGLRVMLMFFLLFALGSFTHGQTAHANRGVTPPRLHASFPLYGSVHSTAYWFADIYFGSPWPQRQSLIVDTGSSVMGFPCSDCHKTKCGTHIDPPYNASRSSSAQPMSCLSGCLLCARPTTSLETDAGIRGSAGASSHTSPVITAAQNGDQCAYHIRYTEGSALMGRWYVDGLWLNYNGGRPSAAEEPQIIQTPFGCHSEETHLFVDQDASGILGLEPDSRYGPPTFLVSVLTGMLHYGDPMRHHQDVMAPARPLRTLGFDHVSEASPVQPEFSMCLSQSGGVLSVGGQNTDYHIPVAPQQHGPESSPSSSNGSFFQTSSHNDVKNTGQNDANHAARWEDLSKALDVLSQETPGWTEQIIQTPVLPSTPPSVGDSTQYGTSSYSRPGSLMTPNHYDPTFAQRPMLSLKTSSDAFTATQLASFNQATKITKAPIYYSSLMTRAPIEYSYQSQSSHHQAWDHTGYDSSFPQNNFQDSRINDNQAPHPWASPGVPLQYKLQRQYYQSQRQNQQEMHRLQRAQHQIQVTTQRRWRVAEDSNTAEDNAMQDQSDHKTAAPLRTLMGATPAGSMYKEWRDALRNPEKSSSYAALLATHRELGRKWRPRQLQGESGLHPRETFYHPQGSPDQRSTSTVQYGAQATTLQGRSGAGPASPSHTAFPGKTLPFQRTSSTRKQQGGEDLPNFQSTVPPKPPYPVGAHGIQWTPLVAVTDDQGRYESYLVMVESWHVKGPQGVESQVELPIIPHPPLGPKPSESPTTRVQLNGQGLLALVDSGTTLTYLPFLVYARLWTSMLETVVASKKASARPGTHPRSLKAKSDVSVLRVSGRSMRTMQKRTETWLQRLEATQRVLTELRIPLVNQTARRLEEAATTTAAQDDTDLLFQNLETLVLKEQQVRQDIESAQRILHTMQRLERALHDEVITTLQNSTAIEQAAATLGSGAPARHLSRTEDILSYLVPALGAARRRQLTLSASAPQRRRLMAIPVPNLDEECWYLSESERDFRYFPEFRLRLTQDADYIWRPHSYLYRKGKTKVYCLSIVPKGDGPLSTGEPSAEFQRQDDEDREHLQAFLVQTTKSKEGTTTTGGDTPEKHVDQEDPPSRSTSEAKAFDVETLLVELASLPNAELKRRLQTDQGSAVLGRIVEAACPITDAASRTQNRRN